MVRACSGLRSQSARSAEPFTAVVEDTGISVQSEEIVLHGSKAQEEKKQKNFLSEYWA